MFQKCLLWRNTIINIYRLSLALLFVFALSSCAVNPVTGQKEFMLVSERQEVDIGKEFYPDALWGDLGGGGEYKDEKLRTYLGEIVQRIHSVSHRSNLPIEFTVQNSSIPNAWAIPGYVVITRGLLAALDNEAEFAFILGHEIGHVSARHTAKHMTYSMLQQVGLAVAGATLSGKEYADLALNVGALGSSLLLLKYSRADELEADRLGILYMAKLGYDQHSAMTAHKRLEEISQEYLKTIGKNSSERGFFEDILSTHPRTSVRIEELKKMIDTSHPPALLSGKKNKEQFQRMISELKITNKLYLDYYDKALRSSHKNDLDTAERLASKAIEADPYQPAFHALKGFILLKKKNYSDAKALFDTAINIDEEYEPALRGKGTLMYFREDYSSALPYLKKSLSIFPNDFHSHYFLGMSYYKMGDYTSALPHLDIYAQANSRHPEIHGILGISHEHTEELNSAYNEYVLQLKVDPDNEMGRYAAQRLSVLQPIIEKKLDH